MRFNGGKPLNALIVSSATGPGLYTYMAFVKDAHIKTQRRPNLTLPYNNYVKVNPGLSVKQEFPTVLYLACQISRSLDFGPGEEDF